MDQVERSIEAGMSDVTRILSALEQGDPQASEQLLPLVYEELRRLAAARMTQERPGHTLDATALVHEAYLHLVDGEPDRKWRGRAHFFAAAADAMRRILVDYARQRKSLKRGGGRTQVKLDESAVADLEVSDRVLALDEALEKFTAVDAQSAELVKLKYFGGLTLREAAECIGIASRTADDLWAYSRAWLFKEMNAD
jgi:RNA polymerase sigma factor (TIGR02999 family)